MSNRVVLLIPHRTDAVEYKERVEILTRARNMIHKLENRIDSKFRAGIGKVCSLERVKESYSEALRALREGRSHVVHINDIPSVTEQCDGEYPLDLETRYTQRTLEADYAGSAAAANVFLTGCWRITGNTGMI